MQSEKEVRNILCGHSTKEEAAIELILREEKRKGRVTGIRGSGTYVKMMRKRREKTLKLLLCNRYT